MIRSTPSASHGAACVLLGTFLTIATIAPRGAFAYTVTVPDDYSSITGALDDLQIHGFYADTVLVRGGAENEDVVIRVPGAIYVIGIPDGTGAYPRVASVNVTDDRFGGYSEPHVERLHIVGLADMDYYDLTWPAHYRDCVIDGGVRVVSYSTPGVTVTRCHVSNGIFSQGNILVDSCTVNGAVIYSGIDPGSLGILQSRVTGGISLSDFNDAVVTGDTTTSISSQGGDGGYSTTITGNLLTGAISASAKSGTIVIDSNSAPGGVTVGLDFARGTITRNRIDGASIGIEVGGYADPTVSILDNVVLHSNLDGIQFQASAGILAGNVVGGSGGTGIHVQEPPSGRSGPIVVRSSTCYLNAGSGMRWDPVTLDSADSLDHNIGSFNHGFGLEVTGGQVPVEGCNDFFANDSGAVAGAAASPQDLAVDPLFCDMAQDDVHLAQDSPLLNAPGCGLIGALGQGCATTSTLVTAFTAERTNEGVRLAWSLGNPSRFPTVWLERSEGGSQSWARLAVDVVTDGTMAVAVDNTALPDRAYSYRLTAISGGGVVVLGQPATVAAGSPLAFALQRVSPNPSTGPLHVEFTLARAAFVSLDLYDVAGRRVAELARGTLAAGVHRLDWPGMASPRGVYSLRYRYPGGAVTRPVIRVR